MLDVIYNQCLCEEHYQEFLDKKRIPAEHRPDLIEAFNETMKTTKNVTWTDIMMLTDVYMSNVYESDESSSDSDYSACSGDEYGVMR